MAETTKQQLRDKIAELEQEMEAAKRVIFYSSVQLLIVSRATHGIAQKESGDVSRDLGALEYVVDQLRSTVDHWARSHLPEEDNVPGDVLKNFLH